MGIDENEGDHDKAEEYLYKDLYDAKTTFMFYSNSNGAAKAGKGSGETTDSPLKF